MPRVAEREVVGGRGRSRRHMASDGDVDAGGEGALGRRVDRDGGAPALPQHAAELGEPAPRVGEEHQGQAAEDRVEAPVGQGEGLAILARDGRVRQPAQAFARPVEHRARDVGGDDVTGGSDRLGCDLGGDACTGGDVEHAVARGDPGRLQEARNELPRDAAEALVISTGARVIELLEQHDYLPRTARGHRRSARPLTNPVPRVIWNTTSLDRTRRCRGRG